MTATLYGGDVEAGSLIDENWLLDLRMQELHGIAGDSESGGMHVEEREAVAELIMKSSLSSAKAEPLAHHGKSFPKLLSKFLAEKKVSDEKLHQYCLYALRQCVEHGNSGFATRLLEMLGKRHATKRKIAYWFCIFGKFGINKDGRLVYRKRRGITKVNIEECLNKSKCCSILFR